MKKTAVVHVLVVFLAFAMFASCDTGLLKNPEDAVEAVEILVAGLMPLTNQEFAVDPMRAKPAIWTEQDYTQPGGGKTLFKLIEDPVWDSEFEKVDESYVFQVTFTDFVVPYGNYEYILNGSFYLELFRVWDTDVQFTLTIFGDEITITGENIDDTFGIDVRTILDIDLTVDGPMLVFAVSGTLEGTVNEIAIDVPDWSFTFQYEDTFTK